MNEDGYTLTDSLAALAVLGLTVGGLTGSLHLIGRAHSATNTAVENTRSIEALNQRVTRLLNENAPILSAADGALAGDRRGFSIACGEQELCRAEILTEGDQEMVRLTQGSLPVTEAKLTRNGGARFVYTSPIGSFEAWPPNDPMSQSLQSISLIEGDGADPSPVVQARIWVEQPVNCAFDPIGQSCR